MGRKIIAACLAVCLFWTSISPAYGAQRVIPVSEAAIRAQYPSATVIHVSSDEYPALESKLASEGYRQATGRLPVSTDEANGVRGNAEMEAPAPSRGCGESRPNRGSATVRVGVDITNDVLSGGNRDGAGAAVVFVIVGTVVLIVWTLYLFRYLYDLAKGLAPCGRWSETMLSSSAISSDPDQHARFAGLRYLTGFRDGYTDYGIGAEIGHADIQLTEVDSLELEGFYWLIGPVLRWRFDGGPNPNLFSMEFGAGSTEHEEMGLVAVAKIGLSFGMGRGYRLGFHYGAMNINLNGDQGIISDRSQYHYLLGVDMGFRF